MSCVLYTNNTSGAALAANSQISFGSTIHRKGRAIVLDGNDILVRGGCNDYATMTGVACLVATAAGEIALDIIVDGVSALTMTATATAADDYVCIPFTLTLKGVCCGQHVVTARVSAAATISAFPVTTRTE